MDFPSHESKQVKAKHPSTTTMRTLTYLAGRVGSPHQRPLARSGNHPPHPCRALINLSQSSGTTYRIRRAYLIKPCAAEDLVRAIRTVLKGTCGRCRSRWSSASLALEKEPRWRSPGVPPTSALYLNPRVLKKSRPPPLSARATVNL